MIQEEQATQDVSSEEATAHVLTGDTIPGCFTRGDLLKECIRGALARRKNHAEPRVEVLALQSPGPENTPSGSPDPETNLREQAGKNVPEDMDTPKWEGEQV